MEIVDKIINFVEPRLYMPEDQIVEYGMSDKSIYFIAQGKLLVIISNHLRVQSAVKELSEGRYFGEVSIVFGSSRTADVQSITHCTLAYLSYQHFQNILDYSPDLFHSLQSKALEYEDDWINFKVVLLK